MTEEPLRVVLACLGSRLKGERGEKANAWANKVYPWLREYWPRPHGRNTAETSRVMVEVLAQCGDAFPEAVAWSVDYLSRSREACFDFEKVGTRTSIRKRCSTSSTRWWGRTDSQPSIGPNFTRSSRK